VGELQKLTEAALKLLSKAEEAARKSVEGVPPGLEKLPPELFKQKLSALKEAAASEAQVLAGAAAELAEAWAEAKEAVSAELEERESSWEEVGGLFSRLVESALRAGSEEDLYDDSELVAACTRFQWLDELPAWGLREAVALGVLAPAAGAALEASEAAGAASLIGASDLVRRLSALAQGFGGFEEFVQRARLWSAVAEELGSARARPLGSAQA